MALIQINALGGGLQGEPARSAYRGEPAYAAAYLTANADTYADAYAEAHIDARAVDLSGSDPAAYDRSYATDMTRLAAGMIECLSRAGKGGTPWNCARLDIMTRRRRSPTRPQRPATAARPWA